MPSISEPANPRVLDVIVRTLRELPPGHKRGIVLAVVLWVTVLGLQVWDSSHQPGSRGIAEFGSVLFGSAGFLLIGLAQIFRSATFSESGSHTRSRAVRQMLMALPAVAASAAMLLASAIAMLVARLWLGASPVVLVMAVTYGIALAVSLGIVVEAARRLYEFGQADASRASVMEAQLADARLAALQAQMNPHFLFNALNTVAALTQTDPRAAEATVEHLAEVLRTTLDRSQQPTSTLADEIRFVRAYLSIESRRLGGRLSVDWTVSEDVQSAIVPSFSLQTLVENAIKHGISPRRDGGRVGISAHQAGDRLTLAVEDDGDGFDEKITDGTGLGNLRERLAVIYGSDAAMNIDRTVPGARVVLELPFRTGMLHAAAGR